MRLAVDAGGGEHDVQMPRAELEQVRYGVACHWCTSLVDELAARTGALFVGVERYLVSICRTSSACVAVARRERTTGTTVTVTWARPSPSRARRLRCTAAPGKREPAGAGGVDRRRSQGRERRSARAR